MYQSISHVFTHAGCCSCFPNNTADFIKSAGAISSCSGSQVLSNALIKPSPGTLLSLSFIRLTLCLFFFLPVDGCL